MTDAQPTNVKYLAEFEDGPLAGSSETRVLVDGTHDDEISAMAALDGKESLFFYRAGETREISGELHVVYTFEPKGSDPLEGDDEDRDSLQF